MIIQWLGQSSFKLQTKSTAGEITVITDPFADSADQKMPRLGADIITVSRDSAGHNNIDAIRGESFVINHPGEYEVKGVFIYGIQAVLEKEKSQSVLYKIISEEIAVAQISDLPESLSDDQIERLGNIDVLLIPVGTIDSKKLADIVSQIDPRIVVPMLASKSSETALNDFFKASGLKSDTMDKLKIAKKDLIAEETRAIILTK